MNIQDQNARLLEENQNLKESIDTKDKMHATLKITIQNYTNHQQTLRSKINLQQAKIARLDRCLNDSLAQVAQLKKELEQKNINIQNLQRGKPIIKNYVNQKVTNNNEITTSSNDKQIQSLQKYVSVLQKQNLYYKNQLGISNKKYQKLEDQNHRLQKNLKEAQQYKIRLQSKVDQLTLSNSKMKNVSDSNISLPDILRENSSDGLPSQINENSKNNGKFTKNKEPHVVGNIQVQKPIDNRIVLEIEGLRKKIIDSQSQLRDLNRQKDRLRQRCANLQQQNRRYKQNESQSSLGYSGQENALSEFSKENIENRRKIYLSGQNTLQNLFKPKAIHQEVFVAVINHFNRMDGKKRTTFLNMLNMWVDEKLEKLYKSVEEVC